MSTTETGAAVGDRGLGPVIEFASRVLAPAGVVTAVLYYFGYVREQALFAYFGVDLGSVGFSTTDYLVRSAGTVFLPLAVVLVAGVAAVFAHNLLGYLLGRASPRWRRVVWITVGVLALGLLVMGVVGLRNRTDPAFSSLAYPLALGSGAVLVEYVVETGWARKTAPPQVLTLLAANRTVRRVLLAALLLVAAFWATADVARQRGLVAARAIEVSLPLQPQAIVYGRDRLQITGPGVSLERLDAAGAAFAFRYNGLRTLVHSNGHWFLLPAGWTRDNGASVIMLPDSPTGIRVDLAP